VLALMGIDKPNAMQHTGAMLVAETMLKIIHRRGLI
jgi:hypothetical protein